MLKIIFMHLRILLEQKFQNISTSPEREDTILIENPFDI